MSEVSFQRSHNHTRFQRQQIHTCQRNAHPGINDDTFIKDAVKNFDEGRSTVFVDYSH